jgi:5-methylcytosine-specific restriction protein B
MTNDEIFSKILSDIEVLLSSHNTFKYAASANTITDVRLEKERQRIIFKRNGEKQSANYDNLKKIAEAFALYKPISIDAVFNGGGNARSAIEAILVRLPHVGFLPANTILNPGSKMLLWLDSPKNNFNSIYNVEDFDLSQAVIANANLNNNAPAIRLRATNQDLTDFKNKFTLDIQAIGLKISSHDLLRNTAALLAKPFLILTGLSGSGKTKLAEALAYWLSSEPNKQICVVAVGADWTNNEPLLGYADAITPGRYCTPASGILQLLEHAINTPTAPHFLILDEMNLSHVERYFADFLSAMESSDPALRLHGSDKDLEISEAFKVPAKLALPPNVFIIGTVNVDETTYMFSPKVLDRANVIEFRVAAKQMEAFLSAPAASVNVSKLAGEGATYAQAFTARANPKMQVHLDATVSAQLQQDLMELFQPLADVGAEFGYRSAKEVARFVAIHREISGEGWQYKDALDAQVMQKLMPKLHGSKRKLDGVMAALKVFAVKHDLPLTLNKVERMNKRLDRDGFTSFAEN